MDKNPFETAPECAEYIFESFRRISSVYDPYKEIKDEQNAKAIEILPKIKKLLKNNEFENMINLAITGNMIDYGVFDNVDVEEYIFKIINKDFYKYDIKDFKSDLKKSNSILALFY
jgi:uncharacterized protein with ATP-grasp and redox domains